LEIGPAMATINSPHFLFLKLFGLKGTGFAQARKAEAPDNKNIAGTIIVPNKSMCGIGFKVILPASSAVLSP